MDALQERLGLQNDAINKTKQFTEGYKQRLSLNNLRLVERYMKGELHVLVAIDGGSVGQQMLADFYREDAPFSWDGTTDKGNACSWRQRRCIDANGIRTDARSNESESCREQEAMLVDNIQLVEHPEVVIPSLVRLSSINEGFGSGTDTVYFSARFGLIFVRTLADRIHGLLGGGIAIGVNHLTDQIIESTSEIVDCIARDQRDDLGNRRDACQTISSQIAKLVVCLAHDFVGLRLHEGVKLDFNVLDVLFGPFDLPSDIGDPVR